MLGTTKQTFNVSFTAYKDAESVTSGWTKLTEAEYDGFIRWSKDKADSEVEKVKKTEEAEEAKAEAKINKEWQKFFTGFRKGLRS